MPNFQFKEVSPQVNARLAVATRVIQLAKQLLPMGAGNQRADVQRTGGASWHLTGMVQQNPNYVWTKPLSSGTITAAYGAGNCQDQAAVVYTILRSEVSAIEKISFCVHQGIHHSFTTIGEPLVDPKNEVVVVDPWPINTQAVLWEDHFCFATSINVAAGFSKIRTKTGGKAQTYQQRLQKHNYAPYAQQWRVYHQNQVNDVDAINSSPGMWNHQYCSKNNITWVYKVRPQWVSDDSRPRCHRCNTSFGLVTRRHHCRGCGEVFCDTCTTGRTHVGIPATRPSEAPVLRSAEAVRVCAPCLNTIQGNGFGG